MYIVSHSFSFLSKLIFLSISSLRLPGSKTKLLEQKIPATYLALEDVVGGIASELRTGGNDPVLNQVGFVNTPRFVNIQ